MAAAPQTQLTSAIKELSNCPESVKQMFLTGLPHAFGPDAHPYQKEFASMMKQNLESARTSAVESQTASSQTVEEARTALEACKADVESMQSAEESAQAALDAEVTTLEKSKAAVKQEEVACQEAEASKVVVAGEKQSQETAKAEVESVKNGSFQMLVDGGWGDDEVRDACIDGVCNYLKGHGGDPVLMAALPPALSAQPAKRGAFDIMAVEEASKTISEKVSILSEQLAKGTETFEDVQAEYLGAWAILDVARDKENAAGKKRDQAEAELGDVVVNKKVAVSKVQEQAAALSNVLSEAALLEAKVQQLDLALGAIGKLEAGVEEDKENAVRADKENVANAPPADAEKKVSTVMAEQQAPAVVA